MPNVVRNLTAAEVATYRTKKSDYDILVDDKTVWIRKESYAEHQLAKLTPQQSMLLRLFLRYRQNQIDARDLFIKISERKPETGISTADLVLTYLTTVITRFRKRMSMHIERTVFDVPYKVGSKEQTGYFCQGTFSSCFIYPQSFDSFLTIKTIPPPSK